MLFVGRPSAAGVGPGWVHTALLLTLLFSRALYCLLVCHFDHNSRVREKDILIDAITSYREWGDRLRRSSVLGNCEKRWSQAGCEGGAPCQTLAMRRRYSCQTRGRRRDESERFEALAKTRSKLVDVDVASWKAGPQTKEDGIDTIKPSFIHVGLVVSLIC
jgi:hypothetical protein